MAAPLSICAQIVVFPQGRCEEGPFDVFVENGLISAIEKCTGNCGSDKLTCYFLTPGFVDIHNHGMGKLSSVFFKLRKFCKIIFIIYFS